MKRWFQSALFCSVALFGARWMFTPAESPRVGAEPAASSAPVRAPAHAVSAPLVLAPVHRAPAEARHVRHEKLDLSESDGAIDSMRPPVVQGKRRWHFLAGVSAIPAGSGRDTVGALSGFDIVRSGDVPDGVEAHALVKREDNGLVGIFTGVIRAVGEQGVAGQFQSECSQGHVHEEYPSLKSYLLKANPSADAQDYFECLSNLRRFETLAWEILDHPRGNR